MLRELIEDTFEINTVEAYNRDLFIFKNHIIIPYINNEVFIDVKSFETHDKFDYSYVIFKDVSVLFWNYGLNNITKYGKLKFSQEDNRKYNIGYVGGADAFTGFNGCEFKVKFQKQYLYLSADVKIKSGSVNMWIPENPPNFERNIEEKDARSFFAKDNIPTEILDLVETKNHSEIEVLNIFAPISPKEEKEIANDWVE
ncbi:MAG: hypothetical protein JXQ93_03325 [Flavobacteriaceae bacterium]